MSQTQDALSIAQTKLNDSAGAFWTSAVMLPHIKDSFRYLQLEIFARGLPVIKQVTTVLTVNSGSTSLSVSSTIPDLVGPLKLREKAVGEAASYFTDMTECGFIPDIPQDVVLRYWAWIGQEIKLLGATTTRNVEVFYKKGLVVPAAIDGSTNLGLIYAEYFVGPMAAHYASKSLEDYTLAADLFTEAMTKLEMIMRGNVKLMQSMPTRRKPFGRSNRRIML